MTATAKRAEPHDGSRRFKSSLYSFYLFPSNSWCNRSSLCRPALTRCSFRTLPETDLPGTATGVSLLAFESS